MRSREETKRRWNLLTAAGVGGVARAWTCGARGWLAVVRCERAMGMVLDEIKLEKIVHLKNCPPRYTLSIYS